MSAISASLDNHINALDLKKDKVDRKANWNTVIEVKVFSLAVDGLQV